MLVINNAQLVQVICFGHVPKEGAVVLTCDVCLCVPDFDCEMHSDTKDE